MSTAAGAPAIEVSNLGKRYRLGVREEARDTLVGRDRVRGSTRP